MLQDVPQCLQVVAKTVATFDALEEGMATQWHELVQSQQDCIAFLNAVVTTTTKSSGNGRPPLLSQPGGETGSEKEAFSREGQKADALHPQFVCLCATYCAAALSVSVGLDVFHPPTAGDNAGADMVRTPDMATTFALFPSSLPPLLAQGTKQEVSDRTTTGATEAAGRAIAGVVEFYFLPSRQAFCTLRSWLAPRVMALPLFGVVLRGYAAFQLTKQRSGSGHRSSSPSSSTATANSARCLRVLARVIHADGTPYKDGGGGGDSASDAPHNTASVCPASPAPLPHATTGTSERVSDCQQQQQQQQHSRPITTRLSIAHAPYLFVARVAHLPAAGLQLLLGNPLLRLAPSLDGVSLVDYIRFYTEGAMLLAELGRYADAAECVYNVTSLDAPALFATLSSDPPPSWMQRAVDSAAAAAMGQRTSNAQNTAAAFAKMSLPNSFTRHVSAGSAAAFVPSQSELHLAHELYQHACCMGVLLTILGFGGAQALVEGSGSSDPTAVNVAAAAAAIRAKQIPLLASAAGPSIAARNRPALARATHMRASLVCPAPSSLTAQYRGTHFAVYRQLWACASAGNLAGFMGLLTTVPTAPSSKPSAVPAARPVLEQAGLMPLALLAMERLRRFVVLSMAAVYDTVPLQMVTEATCFSRLEPATAAPAHDEASAMKKRKMDKNEQESVLQLLTAMHEEGQLLSHLQLRAPRTHCGWSGATAHRNEEEEDEEQTKARGGNDVTAQWVVTWTLPSALPASSRTDYLAHRATYGNCASPSAELYFLAAPHTPLNSGAALPTPSCAASAAHAVLYRSDTIRTHLIAAERETQLWASEKLAIPMAVHRAIAQETERLREAKARRDS